MMRVLKCDTMTTEKIHAGNHFYTLAMETWSYCVTLWQDLEGTSFRALSDITQPQLQIKQNLQMKPML